MSDKLARAEYTPPPYGKQGEPLFMNCNWEEQRAPSYVILRYTPTLQICLTLFLPLSVRIAFEFSLIDIPPPWS